MVAILGPNGAGKTTLVRCLNGLLRPTSGRVSVDQLDASDPLTLWDLRRLVGMVFQNPDNQIVSVTVEREIAFGLENLGLPTLEIRERVEEALTTFHLSSCRHHPPHRLSGGEKQRLAVASVMAMKPRYLILDEPTSLLDPRSREDLAGLLDTIHAETGTTIIHITQFPKEALQAERLLVIVNGAIVRDDCPASVFEQVDELARWGLEAPACFRLKAALGTSGQGVPPETFSNVEDFPRVEVEDGLFVSDSASRAPQPDDRLTVHRLCHTYDSGLPTETRALIDISCGIGPGECVGLIGPTGSGKTTLAEHCMGFTKPESGTILIDGTNIWDDKKKMGRIRRKIGFVFQFPEMQFFEETVDAEIAFGPKQLGLDQTEIERRVQEAMQAVSLDREQFAGRLPRTLSAGEKRLVALASILSMEPEILILDEPTAGLDPEGVNRIEAILRNYHQMGLTILLISHHIDLVARIADRIIVLDGGKIVLEGPPRFVFSRAELLRSIGLDIPEVARIMMALKKNGWDVRTDIFTIEEAKEEILAHV